MTRLPVIPLVLVVAALLCGGPSVAAAQDVSVPALKAAFLSNFAKFATWPEEQLPPGRGVAFCISGDQAVSAALQQSLASRPGQAGENVLVVAPDGPLRSCPMLYLGGMDLRQARRVIDALKGAAVFTVSDIEGFAEAGGVAQLRLENGRMRFMINPGAARRAHLTLSAKLLSLATIVKDGPE